MKKSYLMIAAAAALFAACSSNDTFKDVDNQESAISFNPYAEKVSKAAITGADNAAMLARLADEGGFVVYGYKTKDDWASISGEPIFNGVNVFSNDNGANWAYSRLRFWDKNGKYNFYAVAPYSPSDNATYSINTTDLTSQTGHDDYSAIAPFLKNKKFGFFTITGANSKKSSASDDYLVARSGVLNELGSSHTNTTNDAVVFDFHHIMAKVTFKIKSTLSHGTINVTSLTMEGWNSGAGTFVQNDNVTPGTITKDEWTIPTAGASGTDLITLIGASPAGDASISVTCGTTPAANEANYGDYVKPITDWYIMVPQVIAANSLKFTVTFTYTDDNGTPNDDTDDYTETFANQVATVTDSHTWGTDSYTNYTLDIKPAEIIFDVNQICNFDVNGGNIDTTID